MTDAGSEVRTFVASDGYPLHVAVWPAAGPRARAGRGAARRSEPRGLVSPARGARSPRRDMPPRFPIAAARGPTRAIGAIRRSARRLESATWSSGCVPCAREQPELPIALAGISWGGKARGDRGGPASRVGRCAGACLPGPSARASASRGKSGSRSPGRSSPTGARPSRSRYRTPLCSRITPRARRSSPPTPTAYDKGPPACWRPAFSSTAWSRERPLAFASRPC